MHPTTVRCERNEESQIGRLIIARPDAENAISIEMVDLLLQGLDHFAKDDDVKDARCVNRAVGLLKVAIGRREEHIQRRCDVLKGRR